MSDPLIKLKEFSTKELGLNTTNWDDPVMFVDAIINAYNNTKDTLDSLNQDHENLKNKYIELRNMVSQWNNDFYVHVYGKLPK